MKTSHNLIAAVLVTATMLFTTTVKAQTTSANQLRLGIGLEVADPAGHARTGTDFILGGTARLQYGVSDNFALTLTSGAYHFFTKYIPGTNTRYSSYGVIPIKAGFKAFFDKNLYFGAEAGVGLEETDTGAGPTRFLWSPALGYASTHWDLGVHYDSISGTTDKYGLVGLRLAYGFGL